MNIYDVIIIGGGQAGLSCSYYLKQNYKKILVLEKNNRIGDNWRERYDSLILFTSKSFSKIANHSYQNDSDQDYPSKDEVANYLEEFVEKNEIPIKLMTSVHKVTKNEYFTIETNQDTYQSWNVIIATGPFQVPLIPSFHNKLSNDILQLHSSEYKNKTQLKGSKVAIIGAGNSGVQIAEEISDKFMTILSTGHPLKFVPKVIFGKSIFYWFEKLGLLDKTIHTKFGQWWSKQPDPIFGFSSKKKINRKEILLKPKLINIENDTLYFSDGSKEKAETIIWCTGFSRDYSFLDIKNVLNKKNEPIHRRGITNVDGLYFIGLPWQNKRTSSLLHGVSEDAHYIVNYINDKHKKTP